MGMSLTGGGGRGGQYGGSNNQGRSLMSACGKLRRVPLREGRALGGGRTDVVEGGTRVGCVSVTLGVGFLGTGVKCRLRLRWRRGVMALLLLLGVVAEGILQGIGQL